jgi:hypothetical protein
LLLRSGAREDRCSDPQGSEEGSLGPYPTEKRLLEQVYAGYARAWHTMTTGMLLSIVTPSDYVCLLFVSPQKPINKNPTHMSLPATWWLFTLCWYGLALHQRQQYGIHRMRREQGPGFCAVSRAKIGKTVLCNTGRQVCRRDAPEDFLKLKTKGGHASLTSPPHSVIDQRTIREDLQTSGKCTSVKWEMVGTCYLTKQGPGIR